MFTAIVVALDLEREGDRALPIANSLSELGGVPLELVTVQSPFMSEEVDAFELRQRAAATTSAASCVILHDNDPARAITDYVDSRPDTLLVMSTTAKSPLKSHFLGSVSEAVLNRIEGPVLLVGPHVPATTKLSHPTLVSCVDSTHAATAAVPVVAAWVETFDGAAPWVVEVLPTELETDDAAVVESGHVHHLAQQLAGEGVEAAWEVLHGDDVGGCLEEFAGQIDDAVLMATSTNWTDDRTHWHSTTRRLVQRTTRPVLVIPAHRDRVVAAAS